MSANNIKYWGWSTTDLVIYAEIVSLQKMLQHVDWERLFLDCLRNLLWVKSPPRMSRLLWGSVFDNIPRSPRPFLHCPKHRPSLQGYQESLLALASQVDQPPIAPHDPIFPRQLSPVSNGAHVNESVYNDALGARQTGSVSQAPRFPCSTSIFRAATLPLVTA